jgi:hypothetical protein
VGQGLSFSTGRPGLVYGRPNNLLRQTQIKKSTSFRRSPISGQANYDNEVVTTDDSNHQAACFKTTVIDPNASINGKYYNFMHYP